MINKKKLEKKSVLRDYYDEALDWEASRILEIEKSKKVAWRIVGVLAFCVIMESIGIALLFPLKENTPYVIRVDNVTGVPDLYTALDTKTMQYDEVMDKYWLANFVRNYESYEWYTVQKNYDTIGLMASPNVGAAYAALFSGPDALDKKYADRTTVKTTILSINIHQPGIASVRFQKTTSSVTDPQAQSITQSFVATVGYTYRNPSVLKESDRLTNPFGFMVQSYQVAAELL